MFELVEQGSNGVTPAVIKVIGVGGGGGNAVQYMSERALAGVDLLCANTDLQALNQSTVKNKIQLGKEITRGLGAGANPEVGRKAAMEDSDELSKLLDGADMLFIAAGMGGGTGTGAAPVIAEVAKKAGVLTVAVVTKPFAFEGASRFALATKGIEELSQYVDSIITIPNDKLLGVMDKNAPISHAFDMANAVLYGAVQGISDLIVRPGLINVDFADVKTVMSKRGIAMMGAGVASGEDRAQRAAETAISSPLLENTDLAGAKGVLVNITAGSDLTLNEYATIGDIIRATVDDDSIVVTGTAIDEEEQEDLKVTIVATGINGSAEEMMEMNQSVSGVSVQPTKVTENQAIAQSSETQKEDPVELKKKGFLEVDFEIPAFLRKKSD